MGATIDGIVRVHNVGGTADINGVPYTIESGRGWVNLVKNTASLCCNGIDPSGSELHLLLRRGLSRKPNTPQRLDELRTAFRLGNPKLYISFYIVIIW